MSLGVAESRVKSGSRLGHQSITTPRNTYTPCPTPTTPPYSRYAASAIDDVSAYRGRTTRCRRSAALQAKWSIVGSIGLRGRCWGDLFLDTPAMASLRFEDAVCSHFVVALATSAATRRPRAR